MLRLIVMVLLETIAGVAIGGVLLAIALPALNRYDLIAPDGLAGAVLITLVLVCTIGVMILRPGSAMNRYFRR